MSLPLCKVQAIVWGLSILFVPDFNKKRWYQWKTEQTWTTKPCLPPIQTGVRGRKVFLSIDYTPLEQDTIVY